MDETKIIITGIWIATMLVYLLGDVLRIFSGDFEKMKTQTKDMMSKMSLVISVIMLIPILMVVLTLILPHDISRVANIIVAIIFFLFNIIGVPSYPSWYDRFLIIVSLGFNLLVVYYAWGWI